MSKNDPEIVLTEFTHSVGDVLLLIGKQRDRIKELEIKIAEDRLLKVIESEEVSYVEGLLNHAINERNAIEIAYTNLMALIEVIEDAATKTLSAHYEAIILPTYRETANVRILAGSLRGIGLGCKKVLDAYRAGDDIIAPGNDHVN